MAASRSLSTGLSKGSSAEQTGSLDMSCFQSKTMTPKIRKEPLWRTHDAKAQKTGQRGTIYWVGKSIVGEDGQPTGARLRGASYNGEWQDNKKDGYGVQVYPNGEKYEGQWGSGLRHGEGTLWVPVGRAQKLRKLYVGGWVNDKRHGKGTFFFKNGESFHGYWDNGEMHGDGTLRYDNGDLYVGEWHNGQRSGQGTLNKANGDCYEGSWLNDKREGNGSYFYAEKGKVFVGEWANDLPKAGIYTQASPSPDQTLAVPLTTNLPPVRLAVPAEVLERALMAVRNARKSVRVQATPVNRFFSDDELDALRSVFQTLQRNDGTVGPGDVGTLCSQLGTEVPEARVRQLLTQVGLAGEPAAGPLNGSQQLSEVRPIDFDGFLRVVALLLDEEAAVAQYNPPLTSSQEAFDVPAEYWESQDMPIFDDAM